MQQSFRKEVNLLSVKQIWTELDKKISIRQIYNLIDRGAFGEGSVYRLAGSRGTCVMREAVLRYKNRCLVDVGA